MDRVLIAVKQRLVTGRLHLGHERAFDWSVGDGVVRGAGCACAASVPPQPIGGAFAGPVGEGHVDPGVGAGIEAGEQQHDRHRVSCNGEKTRGIRQTGITRSRNTKRRRCLHCSRVGVCSS